MRIQFLFQNYKYLHWPDTFRLIELSKMEKTLKDVYEKLKHYCAYQERCHQEVRQKLLELKVYGDDLESIILMLIEENYLNEERFARLFSGGKFRIKGWGRLKIRQELKARQISEYCINKGLSEINEEQYLEKLQALKEKRESIEKEKNPILRKKKIAQYLISRGYESDLVWGILTN